MLVKPVAIFTAVSQAELTSNVFKLAIQKKIKNTIPMLANTVNSMAKANINLRRGSIAKVTLRLR